MHLLRINVLAVGKRSKNTDLTAGVMAFNIRRGIALRISELLRKGKRILKGHILINHLGQNEIRRTVKDTGDLDHIVGSQALTHRTDNRNAASDACFKEKVYILLLGDLQKLCSLGCHQFLVGSDNTLPLLQALFHIIICRMETSHNLHNDENLRIVENHIEGFGKSVGKRAVGKITQIENVLDSNFLVRSFRDARHMACENLYNAGTYGSMSHDCDFYHSMNPSFLLFFVRTL